MNQRAHDTGSFGPSGLPGLVTGWTIADWP